MFRQRLEDRFPAEGDAAGVQPEGGQKNRLMEMLDAAFQRFLSTQKALSEASLSEDGYDVSLDGSDLEEAEVGPISPPRLLSHTSGYTSDTDDEEYHNCTSRCSGIPHMTSSKDNFDQINDDGDDFSDDESNTSSIGADLCNSPHKKFFKPLVIQPPHPSQLPKPDFGKPLVPLSEVFTDNDDDVQSHRTMSFEGSSDGQDGQVGQEVVQEQETLEEKKAKSDAIWATAIAKLKEFVKKNPPELKYGPDAQAQPILLGPEHFKSSTPSPLVFQACGSTLVPNNSSMLTPSTKKEKRYHEDHMINLLMKASDEYRHR